MNAVAVLLTLSIIFTSIFLTIQVLNLFTLKKLGRFPGSRRSPFISVLVPARNEAANIEGCIRSLLEQDYSSFEVIVLDDESEDETWSILKRLAQNDGRLKMFKGEPPPAGWVGKCWACHQLAGQARGEYLLFVDADTRHAPSMLRFAVDAADYYGSDLLTAMPGERAETFSEALTIPLVTWGTFAALPLPLAFALPCRGLSITVGQFLFFRRQAYDTIGGHTAVSNHVTEDMELGRLVKEKGLCWRLVDGEQVVKCRMYTNFSEAMNGMSKSIFGALNYRILLVFFFSLLLLLMFFLPPVLLLAAAGGLSLSRSIAARAAAAVVLSLFSWGINNVRFRMPWYATLIFPAIVAVAVFIFFHSMILSIQGKARWKGRVIPGRRCRL